MAASFHFEQHVAFSPGAAADILRALPALPGVFALRAPDLADGTQPQPYLTRAADLRRRITRILAPPEPTADGAPAPSKRLNLRDRVATIEYTVTGSEFESTLTLYHAAASIFGLAEARRRLKLHTPFFLRFTAENAYPRVYATNRLSRHALDSTYGPFPSRAAAERYCDAVLDLFKLRRCYEDLAVSPDHPGCVYQEMKKCLAPCNQAHTPEGAAAYSAEAIAVKRFFDTRGESMIVDIGLEREEASAAMEFERAAALHTQWQKVKAAQALADELVRPLPELRAVIIQRASAQRTAPPTEPGAPGLASETWTPDTAAVFLLDHGCLRGPASLSTLGVRAVKEQTSVGSSLFAQPLMLQAVPLADDPIAAAASHPTPTPTDKSVISTGAQRSTETPASALRQPQNSSAPSALNPELRAANLLAPTLEPVISTGAQRSGETPASALRQPQNSPDATALNPELRAASLLATLEQQTASVPDLATLSDHLSLFRRWYYRPEKQRTGEVFLPNEDSAAAEGRSAWPIRRILRGAARMALGDPAPIAETNRDLAQRNPEEAAQKPLRTKILHEGRPDVERVVHVIDPPPAPRTFTSRRKSRS